MSNGLWECRDCGEIIEQSKRHDDCRGYVIDIKVGKTSHGSPELDADAAKLAAEGADPGITLEDIDTMSRVIDIMEALPTFQLNEDLPGSY
jgi:hypothetical protein